MIRNLLISFVQGYINLLYWLTSIPAAWAHIALPPCPTLNQWKAAITLTSRPPTKTITTQLIRASNCDFLQNLTSGTLLSWMDILAGVAARRHCGLMSVTASVEAVSFLAPLKLGQICIIKAEVTRAWHRSMEVAVTVEGEDMLTGKVKFCCTGFFSFVVTGASQAGPSAPPLVPGISPITMQQRIRYHEAQDRKLDRLSRKLVKPLPCTPHFQSSVESGEEVDVAKRMRSNSLTVARPRMQVGDWAWTSTAPQRVTCSETYTEVTEIIFPHHCNSQQVRPPQSGQGTKSDLPLQITFGGTIFKFMEHCAFISANRCSRTYLSVASIDSMNFLQSSAQGDVVTVRAMVSASYEHSLEIYVTVEKESKDGLAIVTNDGWFTMVAVSHGPEHDIVRVPKVIPVSKLEIERHRLAQSRREKRLEAKAKAKREREE